MSRWILLCVAVSVVCGCNGGDDTKPSPQAAETTTPSEEESSTPAMPGHESPEAVFASLQKAAEAGDVPAALRCLSPRSLETVAASTVLSLSVMAAASPEKTAEIEQFLKKHGISLEKKENDDIPVGSIKDKVAFISESTAWMDANGAEEILGTSYRDRNIPGTLGEVTVEGDAAHAVITVDEYTTDDVRFARLGGNWFVQLPDILGLTPGTTMDAESLAETMGKTLDDSEWNDLFPAPVEAVTVAQFHSSWQVTLDVKAQPAGQLLAKLADELGLEFDAGSVSEATLQKPVTFQVSDGSRLAAIEEICRQIEVTPVYTASGIRVEAGKRRYPAILAGPFLLAVTEFETRPGAATGEMEIQVFAPHLPKTVLSQLTETFQEPVSLDAVTDADDNNLLRDFMTFERITSLDSAPTAFDVALMVKLKNLLKNVESIHRLTGTLSFSLPARVEVLKFGELKPGAEQTSGGVTIRLSEADGGEFTFAFDGIDGDDIQVLVFDRQGKRVGPNRISLEEGDTSGTITQGFSDRRAARFEFRAVTRQESLDYEFNFPEIPVPNFSEMPEQLAELTFEGASPLTLKFVSLGGNPQFPEITFLSANHANKDAASAELKVTCLDADGTEFEEFITAYSKVIPGGKEQNINVTVFDLPQGTKSVTAIVTSVEFTDATTWEMKEE